MKSDFFSRFGPKKNYWDKQSSELRPNISFQAQQDTIFIVYTYWG